MDRTALRQSFAGIATAFRDPEDFAARRHREEVHYPIYVWAGLGLTAAAGTTAYGLTMGLGQGLPSILYKSVMFTLAAGLAWAIPLPALYILNSLNGSRLRPTTTLLAALVTTSWGGLAMLASVPINWLFSTAVPGLPFTTPTLTRTIVLGVNLLVFAGVGTSMVDVFSRVMQRLEPRREAAPNWYLPLVGLIGGQLFYAFGLFDF